MLDQSFQFSQVIVCEMGIIQLPRPVVRIHFDATKDVLSKSHSSHFPSRIHFIGSLSLKEQPRQRIFWGLKWARAVGMG